MATAIETAQQLPHVSPSPSIEREEEELKNTEKVKSRKPPSMTLDPLHSAEGRLKLTTLQIALSASKD
jgi:hypothetical protein